MDNKRVGFQEHEVEEYERKRYRGIDQRIVHFRERSILRKYLDNLDDSPGLILDLPCGYGRFSELLHSTNLPVVNCDISFFMVKRARNKTQEPERLSRMGVVADAKTGLPFKSNVFRCVFSLRFFHHLHESADRENILREFFRVSSEWVILSYYQMNVLHLLQRKLRRKLKRSRTSIKMVSPEDIRSEIAGAGLEAVKVKSLVKGLHAQRIALLKKI